MHDRLLSTLQSVASVRLVASLRDERLGFENMKDIRIFIPDLHLISDRRRIQGAFKYATNHTDLLTSVVLALNQLRSEAASDEVIQLYQLGDFLDLWREADGADDQVDVASAIKDDHEDLVTALMDRSLRTSFLLGNHDFDLYRWPDYSAWERRYYLPDTANAAPGVVLLHGDIFDWVESLPDAVQNVFVYLFAPNVTAVDHRLGEMISLIRQSHGDRKYRTYIQAQQPSTIGAVHESAADEVPARWNVQTPGSSSAQNLLYLDSAYECCRRANEQYQMNLKVAVIGHTHHARIAVREDAGGDFFALIDCGAWIEDCIADGDPNPSPNAQIGALSGNEARIYQLAPL
jgi:UDP-2,3-diacylglucosamine pyrophosphatase LpxH